MYVHLYTGTRGWARHGESSGGLGAATDLVGFLACEHLTALELAAAAGLVERPIRQDPELDLIAQRGLEHERRYLKDLEAAGLSATRIEPDEAIADYGERLRKAATDTETAIRRGDDAICQAAFFDGPADG